MTTKKSLSTNLPPYGSKSWLKELTKALKHPNFHVSKVCENPSDWDETLQKAHALMQFNFSKNQTKMSTILTDPRKIVSLHFSYRDPIQIHVFPTARISPYPEPGLHNNLPWFAIYDSENRLIERINASFVAEITYDAY